MSRATEDEFQLAGDETNSEKSVERDAGAREAPASVVGIGASAGGLEALERLFQSMPIDTGAAFVIVQHLSPDFKSLMGELLARWTRLPISVVEDGVRLESNRIYLMPPRKLMILSGGQLWLRDKLPSDELAFPIDQFFRSLAQDQGPRAVGVVLSGTGTDGSRGVPLIQEAGGRVLVQDPATAKFDGMPNSAIETGSVNALLSPEQMPSALLQWIRGLGTGENPSVEPAPSDDSNDGLRSLLSEYGIDFSLYKPTTVGRRMQRRMDLLHESNRTAYLERLHRDPQEREALYRDLLIGVTGFFRDEDAYLALESSILPDLLAKCQADQEFRVWVAGCATGEEAYSMAILIAEACDRAGRPWNVKVFATDVHRRSIEFAAQGIYPASSVSHWTEERRRRFLVETAIGYQVTSEIRKLVVFATHNLLKDAPFTRLDLVSCRNLLIYLVPSAQNRILSLFHFGMKVGSVLMLGPSESVGELADELETLDAHWKIYRKRRDVRLPRAPRDLPSATRGRASPEESPMGRQPGTDPAVMEVLGQLLASQFPASVLLNSKREIVHALGDANRFLRWRRGKPSLDILELLDRDLRNAVGAAIHRAARERQEVHFSEVRWENEQGTEWVSISATPIAAPRSGEPYWLLSFGKSNRTMENPPPLAAPLDSSQDALSQERLELLESELRLTKQNLQSTIEELETSNEELQAINEEMLASNEELQSTNEELHSVNEELHTVNAEYQRKITELTELTHDMDNLLLSTDVHTIFLDGQLRIRKFTPKMGEMFHLIPADVGRSIEGFMHQIQIEGLPRKLEEVLSHGNVYNEEVKTSSGDHCLLRILPYRGESERSGVVLTLIDITELKKAESRFRHAIEASPSGMLLVDSSGKISLINSECEAIFGYDRDELIGRPLEFLVPERLRGEHRENRERYFSAPRLRGMSQGLDVWGLCKDGTEIPLDIRLSPIEGFEGMSVLASIIDMTRSKKLESSLRLQVDQRDRFLATLSHELRNPMAAIVSAATLLSRMRGGTEACEPCGIILRQAAQMTALLDDLLDVSRVTQGKIKLRQEPIDLRDICRESLETVEPLIAAHRHHVTVRLPETPVFVDADRGRIMQVVENLLTNAIKYTQDAGAIELTLAMDGKMASIVVKDNGRGIEPELLQSIFDMFVQSDSTLEHSDGGMGVGLTLVKTLVELHGGIVHASSPGAGLGSTFTVELPVTSRLPDHPATRVPSGAALSGIQVVLVEDNRDARLMLESLLSMDGYEVHAAANGVQGLAMILDLKPPIAVVDIGLPGMDGYEIARRVRAAGHNEIRLVALTGYGRDEDRQAVHAAGFNHHLVKPVRIDEMEAILNSVRSTRPN